MGSSLSQNASESSGLSTAPSVSSTKPSLSWGVKYFFHDESFVTLGCKDFCYMLQEYHIVLLIRLLFFDDVISFVLILGQIFINSIKRTLDSLLSLPPV